eukprot:12211-Eustigmatos_ZCMA.PRE.1
MQLVIPFPRWTLSGPVKLRKDVRMVLGLDTSGQARAFRAPEIAAALKWAKELATALEAADDQLWDEEVARVQAYIAVRLRQNLA